MERIKSRPLHLEMLAGSITKSIAGDIQKWVSIEGERNFVAGSRRRSEHVFDCVLACATEGKVSSNPTFSCAVDHGVSEMAAATATHQITLSDRNIQTGSCWKCDPDCRQSAMFSEAIQFGNVLSPPCDFQLQWRNFSYFVSRA